VVPSSICVFLVISANVLSYILFFLTYYTFHIIYVILDLYAFVRPSISLPIFQIGTSSISSNIMANSLTCSLLPNKLNDKYWNFVSQLKILTIINNRKN
jgi:hypothetical protein